MSDHDLTHSITVTVTGLYQHGVQQHATLTMAGDGSLDHALDTFKAALVAMGFSAALAEKLTVEG